MPSDTMSAAAARHQMTVPSADATAVPTRTGTTDTGRVRGRAPATQRFMERQTTGVNALVAIELAGGRAFVDALLRVWDGGDAALPLDPRLPAAARTALLGAMDPGGRPVEPGDALVIATS